MKHDKSQAIIIEASDLNMLCVLREKCAMAYDELRQATDNEDEQHMVQFYGTTYVDALTVYHFQCAKFLFPALDKR